MTETGKHYLERYNIPRLFEEIMGVLIKQKPEDPFATIVQMVQRNRTAPASVATLKTNETLKPFKLSTTTVIASNRIQNNRRQKRSAETTEQALSEEFSLAAPVSNANKPSEQSDASQTELPSELAKPEQPIQQAQEVNAALDKSMKKKSNLKLDKQKNLEKIAKLLETEQQNNKENLAQLQADKLVKSSNGNAGEEDQQAVELIEDDAELAKEMNLEASKPMQSDTLSSKTSKMAKRHRPKKADEKTFDANLARVSMEYCPNCCKLFHQDDNQAKSAEEMEKIHKLYDEIESVSEVGGPRKMDEQANQTFRGLIQNEKNNVTPRLESNSILNYENSAGWNIKSSPSNSMVSSKK